MNEKQSGCAIYPLLADITRLKAGAIVNSANASLLAGSGVCGAIHRRAGADLERYCRNLGGCAVGQAKISPSFALPADYVIHTVDPVWQDGDANEGALLTSCYTQSLKLALQAVRKFMEDPAHQVQFSEVAFCCSKEEQVALYTAELSG